MILPYLIPLQTLFEGRANASLATRAAAYMKGNHVYYGMMTPTRRALIESFYNQHSLPDAANLDAIVFNTYAQPQREFHLFVIELLYKQRRQ